MNAIIRSRFVTPTSVTFIVAIAIVVINLHSLNWNPLELVRMGTRFSEGDANGTTGYDGQFIYYMARDLDPSRVASLLDIPAYRYQRILLPLIANLLSFGNPEVLIWLLVSLVISSLVAGTWAIQQLLSGWGLSQWYALIFGLWAGFLLSVIVVLPEPLAYGFVSMAVLALERGKRRIAWLLLGLSTFAKEITILFIIAAIVVEFIHHRWKDCMNLGLVALAPFIIFQIWLWVTFGEPGLGTGGDLATPFEWIPFMGLLRIATASPRYFLAMVVVFGPTVVLPSIWGVWRTVMLYIKGQINFIVIAAFLNCLMIPFLPFSTFRETGGILRLSSGLMVAIIFLASRYRQIKVLNYCYFWLVLNVFLFKS
jgi:hypothetical protein